MRKKPNTEQKMNRNNNNEDDMNFKKIQNSKLFQKFMKEEISNEIDSQPNLYENYRYISSLKNY